MRQLVSHTCIEEGVFNCKNIILELFNISTIWFLIFINSFKFWMPFFGDAARNKWDLSSSHNISRNNIFFLPQANTFHTADRQANFSLSKRKAHWHFQEDWVCVLKYQTFLSYKKIIQSCASFPTFLLPLLELLQPRSSGLLHFFTLALQPQC